MLKSNFKAKPCLHGERDCRDESADGAVTMLFAAVGVQLLGSETTETNLRTLLFGWRCWGARLRRRICGRCCYHMLFAAVVGVQLLGSDTEETNLRTLLLPCYLQLLGCRCWGARRRRRICGRCCYHATCSCWSGAAGERYGGEESADGAVTMLFAAVGGAVAMLFAAVGLDVLGSVTAETNLRTVLLPCHLQVLGWRCWGARRRRRICGRCGYHMLFAAVGVQVLGSEAEGPNLRTLLLPCYLELLG